MIIIHHISPENFMLAKRPLSQTLNVWYINLHPLSIWLLPKLIPFKFQDFKGSQKPHLFNGMRDSMSIFEDHAAILFVGIVRKPNMLGSCANKKTCQQRTQVPGVTVFRKRKEHLDVRGV